MVAIDSEALLERFLRYVRVDTQSDETSPTSPSSACQWDLLRLLATELAELGVQEIELDGKGFTFGTVPARSSRADSPTIGFVAHVDTASDVPARGVKPIVHRNYDGGIICLPDNPKAVLDPEKIPFLRDKVGETLITASGTTLLGADDKAAVAILLTVVETLSRNPSIPHPRIRLCFSPDEEIGRGIDMLDLSKFRADVAYTLDTERPGEINCETFSADKAVVTVRGVAAHPGWAKGVMVNAVGIAAEFLRESTAHGDVPEKTTGREGFVHPDRIEGDAHEVRLNYLLRDFELEGLAAKGQRLRALAARLMETEPRCSIEVRISPQYRNMRYWLDKDMRPVDIASTAMRRVGLEPITTSMRGGTDGSKLTERGIPTPNIFCGFHNIHSQLEWISLQDMELSARVVIEMLKLWDEGKAFPGSESSCDTQRHSS